MNEQNLSGEDGRAIEEYLAVLKRKQLPVAIAAAIAAIEVDYKDAKALTSNQVAILFRCCRRAMHKDGDRYPSGAPKRLLEYIDGAGRRMSAYQATRAHEYLGNMVFLRRGPPVR